MTVVKGRPPAGVQKAAFCPNLTVLDNCLGLVYYAGQLERSKSSEMMKNQLTRVKICVNTK
jgi:hypothetical protein